MQKKNLNTPSPKVSMEKSLQHFHKYLREYESAKSLQDQNLAKDKMAKELEQMSATCQLLSKECRVLERRLHKDFQVFFTYSSKNNYSVIAQDLEAIEESLKL